MKKILPLLFVLLLCGFRPAAQVQVGHLLTENQNQPIGLASPQPRFSWQLQSDKRQVRQTAYEIRVSPEGAAPGLGRAWRSGKVASDSSVLVSYRGKALQPGMRYLWQVRVWDQQDKPSAWATSSFRMALLHPSDWQASWISSGLAADTVNGIVPRLRKTFRVKKKIRSALAYITARGLYEAHLNGRRVGDAYLTPGWTSYHKHLPFHTYDVTRLLTPGQNAVGVLLGSGWYRTRLTWLHLQNFYGQQTALLFQLAITYADGSRETIVSDGSWKTSPSHITYAEIYDGESQDGRLGQHHWTLPALAEQGWTPVVVRHLPKDQLRAAINEPIRQQQTFRPRRVLTTPKGETVLDFGQNLVGWVQVRAQGQAGDQITLSHAEVLDKQGNLYFDNLRTAKAQARYTLRGGGPETFEPHFTFFGFRYVRVEGLQGPVKPENFTAVALYSDMKPSGSFTCSNPLVNQLQHNIQWGQRGNFLDVPTDCPQRDERLGWTGDAQVFSRTAAFNFNVNQFFAKWLLDVAADQEANGAVPFVVPNVLKGTNFGSPVGAAGWSDASIIIPWNMYLAYGDKALLARQYPSMKAYLHYMRRAAKNDLWNTGFQFADWLSYRVDDSKAMVGQKSAVTDNYLVAQCFYAYSVELMLKTARLLGQTGDALDYATLLDRVKAAFQAEYMTASGRLISETQTAYVLALQFDMLPEQLRAQAANRLENNIRSYDYHLTTGFLGTPFLNHVLTRFGKTDVAYKLLLQDTYPSWLFPVKMGATTIWERWDSQKPDGSFQDPSMTSFNHYAYGAVGDWMYRVIAGLDTEEEGAGYKAIRIKPHLGGGLTHAAADYDSYYGRIRSAWKLEGGQLLLEADVPANTTATIYVPAANAAQVREGGKALAEVKGLQVAGTDPGYVIVKTGSGKYRFSAPAPKAEPLSTSGK